MRNVTVLGIQHATVSIKKFLTRRIDDWLDRKINFSPNILISYYPKLIYDRFNIKLLSDV